MRAVPSTGAALAGADADGFADDATRCAGHRDRTRALFVDVAGVLLDDAPPSRANGSGAGLRGGAGAALRLLDRLDYRVIMLAPCSLERRHAAHTAHFAPGRLTDLLRRERIDLAGVCCCRTARAPCATCPPSPAMLLQAAHAYGFAMDASWLLARNPRYLDAGRQAGCRTILVGGDVDGAPDAPPRQTDADPVAATAAAWFDYQSRDIVDAALAIIRIDGG